MTDTKRQSRLDWMTERLTTLLTPAYLAISDDSQRHEGHGGWREGGETHYSIDIVSEMFSGKSRVERHRLVNDALEDAFRDGLHALAIKARAPSEQ